MRSDRANVISVSARARLGPAGRRAERLTRAERQGLLRESTRHQRIHHHPRREDHHCRGEPDDIGHLVLEDDDAERSPPCALEIVQNLLFVLFEKRCVRERGAARRRHR